MSFLLVFCLVLGLSGFLGHHLFGRYSVGFYTWSNAVITNLRAIFGDFDYPELVENRYNFGLIYFLLVSALMTVLLMNVMLAIVIGAFVEIQPATKKSGTLSEDLMYILKQVFKRIMNIVTCVHCCKGHVDIIIHNRELNSISKRRLCHKMLQMTGCSRIMVWCRHHDNKCIKKWKKRGSATLCRGFLVKPCCGGSPYVLYTESFNRMLDVLRRAENTQSSVPAFALSTMLSRVTDAYDRKYIINRLMKKSSERRDERVARFYASRRLNMYHNVVSGARGAQTTVSLDPSDEQSLIDPSGLREHSMEHSLMKMKDEVEEMMRSAHAATSGLHRAADKLIQRKRKVHAEESSKKLSEVVTQLMEERRSEKSKVAAIDSGMADAISDRRFEHLERKMDGIIAAIAAQSEVLQALTENYGVHLGGQDLGDDDSY
jgi:hypothetical protein